MDFPFRSRASTLRLLGTTIPSAGADGRIQRRARPFSAASGKITHPYSHNTKIPQRGAVQLRHQFRQHPLWGLSPRSGQPPTAEPGNASITVLGIDFPGYDRVFLSRRCRSLFHTMFSGAQSSSSNQDAPWLSQDLRVFTATPSAARRPGSGSLAPICCAGAISCSAGSAILCRKQRLPGLRYPGRLHIHYQSYHLPEQVLWRPFESRSVRYAAIRSFPDSSPPTPAIRP